MGDAKSITPTVFGFLIAYLLPGMLAVITAGLFFPAVGTLLLEFSKASSSTGLAILLLLTALLAGVQLHILTWAVYQELILKKSQLSSDHFAKLRSPLKAAQWEIAVNQNLRYHQFSGAQSLLIPVFCFALFRSQQIEVCSTAGIILLVATVIVEGVTIWSAIEGGKRYFERCKALAEHA